MDLEGCLWDTALLEQPLSARLRLEPFRARSDEPMLCGVVLVGIEHESIDVTGALVLDRVPPWGIAIELAGVDGEGRKVRLLLSSETLAVCRLAALTRFRGSLARGAEPGHPARLRYDLSRALWRCPANELGSAHKI